MIRPPIIPEGAAPSIICLGLSALDRIWRVETPFTGGSEKIRAGEHLTEAGGMAANAAVTVARLGGRASFWGRAGDDDAGRLMAEAFAAEGVDIGQFRLFEGGASSVSGIIVDARGERQIVNFRGRYPVDPAWLSLAGLSADCVLADPRWPEGAEALFTEARRRGIPTVLDGDVADADIFERLLPLTDHAVFSEPGLRGFGGEDLDAALALAAGFGCRMVAVTRGGDGLVWQDASGRHDMPAPAVQAVDTTAAGDVFHGAYAFAIGANFGIADALAFASAVAALKCTRPGGRAAIPSLDDLKSS
ncbi:MULTISPECIES: sugar kinase [unclassified Shinella]|uniref:sugar kinase n=1 Tax=unclassified Shinella TaxID=2643062 RepID=UPI00225DBFC8|nr:MULTISPECIES: sugar kinase [unclassified Shinella]MCO5137628.1 sugar kinase [Shinella sp.]MDC7257746.1 sugar kinase [Shinella sp. YE25]CAI0335510.1 6-deoxy-6-sulfofructose kinase [Rhizobiaceae bacterium]CAK7259816.1 6-deoxy-6-sulfofructose kinase [Shinella sp. WSC3-e]